MPSAHAASGYGIGWPSSRASPSYSESKPEATTHSWKILRNAYAIKKKFHCGCGCLGMAPSISLFNMPVLPAQLSDKLKDIFRVLLDLIR